MIPLNKGFKLSTIDTDIWERFKVEDEEYHFKQIGPLKLWIRNKNSEWLIAIEKDLEDKDNVVSDILCEENSDIVWNRFVTNSKGKSAHLTPVALDRAVVVKPESELKILSGSEALFYVLMPLNVKVSVGTKKEVLLTEISTQTLSNTWFGEPHNGMLCYSLKTSARRSIDDLKPKPHQVICPVYIKNSSPNDLIFTRLCIRTEYLSIYKGVSWLWTNKVHFNFRGSNHASKITYNSTIPDFEEMMGVIGIHRSKPTKDFSFKSFDTFKRFTGA